MTELGTPLRYLKGAGPARAGILAKLDLRTLADLLEHYPRAYLDRASITPLGRLQPGPQVTAAGRIRAASVRRARTGRRDLHAILEDETGSVECVWFNQPYLAERLRHAAKLIVSGKVDLFRHLRFVNPEFEIVEAEATPEDEPAAEAPGIVPVYPLTGGISQRMMRRLVRQALEAARSELEEFMPAELLARRSLMSWNRATAEIHFPSSQAVLAGARRRIAFQEFFDLQFLLALSKRRFERAEGARPLAGPGRLLATFLERLPFTPTAAQKRAIDEIREDLARDRPMHRLLEGDVGSGKTAVALAAALIAVEAGAQVALMAPTEILAAQHAGTFARFLAPLDVRTALLAGGMGAREAREVREGVRDGEIAIAIGTHALFQEAIEFRSLGLVIVDEQHRFGVVQRASLLEKGGSPHALIMSATPIPRTLALTVYGDLDLSILDEKPPGRLPPRTHLVPAERYAEMLSYIGRELAAGAQAYFVAPLIEASEELDLKAAEQLHARLTGGGPLCGFAGGLLHGRLKAEEKETVMQAFSAGGLRFLVATTVIEVGVDIPNASLMVIEHPERYGLSQLHQLRGRIGRGRQPAHLFLVQHRDAGEPARERMRVLAREDDGFRIAEEDLRQRGPGDFFGVRQSGLPPLKVADPLREPKLLAAARAEAFDTLAHTPFAALRESRLWRRLSVRVGEGLKLYEIG
ncbi:MAG: ATP-dependent DNA helicase RecG [Candidatus Eisenbacteria bacterium]